MAVINGNSDNEVINGTSTADSINGADGDDTISGSGGNDSLYGSGGNDILTGGANNDYLEGGNGNDTYTFNSGDGQDVIRDNGYGQDNNTLILGNIAPNQVTLSQSTAGILIKVIGTTDQVNLGWATWDRIDEIKFSDNTVWDWDTILKQSMLPTGNADKFWGDERDNIVSGGAGNDSLYGGGGNDTLIGGTGNDYLEGAPGNHTYIFNRGDGQDVIRDNGYSQDYNTLILGNIAPDQVTLSQSATSILIKVIGTADQVNLGWATWDRIDEIKFSDNTVWDWDTILKQSMLPTGNADTFWGDERDNIVSGGAGNDSLYGGGGNDTLIGGTGNDYLEGSPGDQTYIFNRGDGQDVIRDNGYWQDNNILILGDIAPNQVTLSQSATSILIKVIGTTDQISFGRASWDLIDEIRFSDNTVWDWDTILMHSMLPTGEADTIWGDDRDNIMEGGTGDDSLYSGDGTDTLNGGAGNDSLEGGAGDDTYIFNRGDGQDIIFDHGYSSDTNTLLIGVNPDQVFLRQSSTGNSIIVQIAGTSDEVTLGASISADYHRIDRIQFADNTIWDWDQMLELSLSRTGTAGDDKLWGTNQADTMTGYAGNDTYVVNNQNDVIVEQANEGIDQVESSISYTLSTNVENLQLANTDSYYSIDGTGNALNNVITGNDDWNHLSGAEGNDTLAGGKGDDTLTGGTGDDLYLFSLGDGHDTISAESESRAGRLETLQFGQGIAPESMSVKLNGADLELSIANTDDKITIQGFYANNNSSNTSNPIQQIFFSGSNQSWDLAKLTALAQASLVITGTAGDNELYGTDTADKIYGLAGNDTLDGGAGADTMYGGTGDDSYWVDETGDSINELANEGTDTVMASVNWTLGDNLEKLFLEGEAISGTGNTLNNLLVDNYENNLLIGLDGNDTLENYWGGTDTLVGGNGDDVYTVSDDRTTIIEQAGEGNDWIQSFVTYTASANIEGIRLIGEDGINATGNDLNNWLQGNSQNNRLTGGAGNDNYYFGRGDGQDTITAETDTRANRQETLTFYNNGLNPSKIGMRLQGSSLVLTILDSGDSVTIEGFTSNNATCSVQNVYFLGWGGLNLNTWAAGLLANIVTGDAGNNVLNGTAGVDRIYGLAGNDTLTGNAGNDTLDGGAGADKMSGGSGDDLYLVDNASDTVTENANEGADMIRAEVSYTAPANVENLTLTGTGNTNATGNVLPNVLTGNAGNNALDGAAGADTLVGGAGNDTYTVDVAGDVVKEEADQGIDTILSAVTYTASANVENLTLTGSAAVNATGNALANTLTGNGGNNVLDGGAGNDTLVGGKGNDTYVVDAAGDVVTEKTGEGTDLIQASVSYTASANVENLTLTGSAAINATGNALANVLVGNSAANTLDGGAGADKLSGGAGNDTYVVDIAGDTVSEGVDQGIDLILSAVAYTVSANVENLTLTGSAGVKATGNALDNVLTGNSGANALDGAAGNDTLDGGAGNDTLTGGVGADLLTGGAGNDLFVFAAGSTVLTIGGSGNAGTLAGHDRISDFTLGFVTGAQDKIDTIGTPVVVANTSGVNGIDSKLSIAGQAIKSHAIKDGMITFDDADTYAAPLSLGSLSDVAAVVQYLQGNNLGKAGASVAFDADTGGVHHTFLFTQGDAKGTNNTLDVLVDLIGVDAGRLAAATAGMTASTLLIG